MIAAFRGSQTSPILSLWARDEEVVDAVDYLAFSDAPDKLLKSVASIMDRIASI
jgi:hypothetical protein